MLACSMYFIFGGFYYFGFYRSFQSIYVIGLPIVLLIIPLFYFYIESLTVRNFSFARDKIIHLLPALSIFVLDLPFCLMTSSQKHDYINSGVGYFDNPTGVMNYLSYVYYLGYFGFLNLQILIYTFLFINLLQGHKLNIENRFSYYKNIDLKWLVFLLLAFFSFFIINDISYMLGIKETSYKLFQLFFNITLLLIQLFLGLFGLLQKDIYKRSPQRKEFALPLEVAEEKYGKGTAATENILVETPVEKTGNPVIANLTSLKTAIFDVKDRLGVNHGARIETNGNEKKYAGSLLSDIQKQQMAKNLDLLMKKDKEYLNEKLTIDDISDKLKTNNRYLSQVINELYNKNFFTYINTFRIKEAQNLLVCQQHKKYSITGISKMVGFSSKSSFNEAFKRITGITPSEFKKLKGME
jgi:AraC-like DNA-binding protein